MRLRRLDLTRYGKFTDYSIDFGEHKVGTPDLHIIYGLNEAGKSTSLNAYLDLLFGIEERTRYGFLHQGKAMEIGACLEFDGQAHEFKRIKQRNNSLLNEQGQPLNDGALSVPLAGLSRDAYRMMFSLDDQTLEDGGNAILESKGDLGELLFSASAGLAGVSSILEAATSEADGIFRKRASSTKIASLKRQIADLKSQRDEIDTQASAYRALTAELEQAEAAYDAVMKEISAAKTRQDEIARVLRTHPLVGEYNRGKDQLSHYDDLPRPPDEWATALPNLVVEEARFQTRLTGLDQRERTLRSELAQLVTDEHLLATAERIDQLADAAARYATAEEDLPKRKEALSQANRKLDMILASLGHTDVKDPKALLIQAATIGMLRDLISEKSGIDVALLAAEKEHVAAQQALENEQRARKTLDVAVVALNASRLAQLQSALNRVRNGNLSAELRLAERSLTTKRQAFDDAVARLFPWSGDGDALRRISLPSADRRETWKLRLSAIEQRRAQIIERQRELTTRQDEETARIAALRASASILDDEQTKLTLTERDEIWKQHLAALDRETAARFEKQMRKTDEVVTARLDRAKELEELRSLTAALAVTTANNERQRQLLEETNGELATLRHEIQSETPSEIALPTDASLASWLAKTSQWAEGHAAGLAAWDDLRQTLHSVEQARTALAKEQDGLAKALSASGVEMDALDLTAMTQAAENLLSDHTALQAKRVDADKRIAELETAVSQRKTTRDGAAKASEEWQRGWSDALMTTWFADRQHSIGAVRELLDVVVALPEALREQADLHHRITSMEANQKSFVDTVAQIYEVLDNTCDDTDPLTAARTLIKRLDEARHVATKRQERDQSLAGLALERENLDSEIALHAAHKTQMTEFFGVETLAEVRQALDQSGNRDKLVAQQHKLEQQIFSEMQMPSLDIAMDSASDVDLSELQREQAELVARLDALDERSKTLFANKARAAERLSAIGGDDAVARLEAQRRTLLLEVEDLALRYLRLRSGNLIAEHGIRAYRDKHRSAMMNRASEAFRLITRGEYNGLATRPDKDKEVLIGLPRNGGSKVAVEMSKGTQFQLYLALRLAGYEEFAMARPSVPFIADDIMETFDEPRSEEVFRLFGRMAEVGQVIYLTHHRHLCDIATEKLPFAKVHEISSVTG